MIVYAVVRCVMWWIRRTAHDGRTCIASILAVPLFIPIGFAITALTAWGIPLQSPRGTRSDEAFFSVVALIAVVLSSVIAYVITFIVVNKFSTWLARRHAIGDHQAVKRIDDP